MHEQELHEIGKCLKRSFPGFQVALKGMRETDFEFEIIDPATTNQYRIIIPVEILSQLTSGEVTYEYLFESDSGKSFIESNPNKVIYHYTTGFTLVHA